MATEDVPWVLCIDDDADFSDALKIRFEEHGVAVARAANGMEGYCMAFSLAGQRDPAGLQHAQRPGRLHPGPAQGQPR